MRAVCGEEAIAPNSSAVFSVRKCLPRTRALNLCFEAWSMFIPFPSGALCAVIRLECFEKCTVVTPVQSESYVRERISPTELLPPTKLLVRCMQ